MSAEGTPPYQHMGTLSKREWTEAENFLPRLRVFFYLIFTGIGPHPQPSTLVACPPSH